jgi:glycosyltransferase involved in cell wall biosynthesis
MTSICLIVQAHYDHDVRVRRKADALVAAGYSVDVLALRPPQGKKEYTLNGVNVRTLSLGKQRGSLPRYLFEYSAFFLWTLALVPILMRRRRYAVIDVNTLPDFLVFAAVAGRWMGAKLVLDMHEITPEFYMSKYGVGRDSWLIRLLTLQERLSFRFADRVLTINQSIEDLLVARGLDRTKSTIVMNSADESRFVGAQRTAPANPDEGPARRFVMIYHGTLTKVYGLDIAVDAFGLVHSEMPDAEFVIVGGGPELEPLRAQAHRLGISDKVRLVGQVPPSEIPGWLRRATIGVLPIRQDVFLDHAFPNKLPEFIISGITVLVSRLRAIRYYFSDEALAYAEPNSPSDLSLQMLRLYRDPQLCDRLQQQARREYTPVRWDVMKGRYLTVIEQLTGVVPEAAHAERMA